MKRNNIKDINKDKLKLNYKLLWALNLVLFVSVVFLGIEQAGRGAEISNLENQIEEKTVYKRDLSEEIFKNDDDEKIVMDASTLGFVKPNEVHYFKTDEVYASILK